MVSRLDLGSTRIDRREMDLNEAVRMLVSDRLALFAERKLDLSVETEPALAPIRADPRLIEQVLTNLLTNAMNYTPEGGAVALRTGIAEIDGRRWATVGVEDTGIGIPPEELGRLFRRFERGQARIALQIPGTGLGLAISKRRSSTSTTARSPSRAPPGKGSLFVVWLPLGRHGSGPRRSKASSTHPWRIVSRPPRPRRTHLACRSISRPHQHACGPPTECLRPPSPTGCL